MIDRGGSTSRAKERREERREGRRPILSGNSIRTLHPRKLAETDQGGGKKGRKR